MSINKVYNGPDDMPHLIAVFPLSGALLLPRGEIPLNIFEPRYLGMIDDAMRSHRIFGVIQPAFEADEGKPQPALQAVGCAGRITQLSETGDGRYVLTLTGIARFRIIQELQVTTAYRQCAVDYSGFADDFISGKGAGDVDRDGVLRALKGFAEANRLKVEWDSINEAPNEALVNALSMMSPFGPREKQALLEAPDLRQRADVLIAISEMEVARASGTSNSLQ